MGVGLRIFLESAFKSETSSSGGHRRLLDSMTESPNHDQHAGSHADAMTGNHIMHNHTGHHNQPAGSHVDAMTGNHIMDNHTGHPDQPAGSHMETGINDDAVWLMVVSYTFIGICVALSRCTHFFGFFRGDLPWEKAVITDNKLKKVSHVLSTV